FSITANLLTSAPNTVGQYPRNNGTSFQPSAIQTQDLPYISNSYTSTGVIGQYFIAKQSGYYAVPATITDTAGLIGICQIGCSSAGTVNVAVMGNAICVFDGATTAGDYVQASMTAAAECHDVGAVRPGTGQAIGRVL